MKKSMLWSAPLVLALLLTASLSGIAGAGDLAPSVPQAPQPAVAGTPACQAQPTPLLAVADAAQAPAGLGLFTPEPLLAGPCPRIGCGGSTLCKQDQDCTALPGGVCNHFCPSQGCCSYPAQ